MKKRVIISLILFVLSAALIGGCGKPESPAEPTVLDQTEPEGLKRFEGENLTLFVAAGMKNAMDQTIAHFEQESGAKVSVNYGPSGGLFAQIELEQPCDLFYSADWLYITMVEDAGKADKSLKFLKDNLVLVVSPGGESKIKSMQDLINPGISLVIADAQAPVGVYSDNALRELGLSDKLGKNIKARPSTVNQVAIMVQQDQVDAGLIYSSVANGNDLVPVEVIDEKYTGEIVFGAVSIKQNNTEIAEAFMDFACEHVDYFEQYGWARYE